MTIRTDGCWLTSREHGALIEALRRRLRFREEYARLGRTLTTQWTGLGSATAYKASVESGFMKLADDHQPNPGHIQWWQLTDKGALIVAYWIGAGFDSYTHLEEGDYPPQRVPLEVLC